MTLYSTLNEQRVLPNTEDVRGTRLMGRDSRELGIIRDVVFESSTGDLRYFVVEHGYQRCVLVPLDRVFLSGTSENLFNSEMSQEDLSQLPLFDPKVMRDARQWQDYEKLYRSSLPNQAVPISQHSHVNLRDLLQNTDETDRAA